MFHKREDRLQRLNEELLAEEEEYIEEYEDEQDADLLEDELLADILEEDEEEEDRHPVFRSRYDRGNPTEFDDNDFEQSDDLYDDEFLYRDDYRSAKKHQHKVRRAEKKAKRKERKGKLGIAILALIELIAIGGILAWWASWVL